MVNDRSVSPDEFLFAYETSPRAVISGPKETAYRNVLNRMAERILLAQEAERLGLHADPENVRELQNLEDAAIRRELFMRQIRNKVDVTEDDCRKAFLKDQQTLWIQHAIIGSEEQMIPGEWKPEWRHVQINPSVKTVEKPGFGPIDLVRWNDVDETLEEVLFSLAPGELSGAIIKNGYTHIFRLVNTETNVMLSENEYNLQREHYRSAITKRKEHRLAFKFVQDVMSPENLTIRHQTLNQLTEALWQQQVAKDSVTMKSPGELNLNPLSLDDLNEKELATFSSGNVSVEDFRFLFRMNPLELSKESKLELKQNIINAIGLYVRDIVFAEKGRALDLENVIEVQDDFKYWRERLLASKMEASVYAKYTDEGIEISEEIVADAVAEYDQLRETLMQAANITINEELLMTIETSDEGLSRKIDFFANYLN